MKLVKLLLGALALASTGQVFAQASITGTDLVLEAWDINTNTSYTRDLGSLSTFLTEIGNSGGNTALNGTITLGGADSIFGNAFGTETSPSNIVWNILGLSKSGVVSGFVSSSNPSNVLLNGSLTSIFTNVAGLATYASTAGNSSTNSTSSAAFSSYNAGGYGGGGNWGDSIGNQYSQTTADGFSTLTAAYVVGAAHGSSLATFNFFNQNGGYDFFSLLSTGAVEFTGFAVPTPLPAAAWLLGSGLLGLFGIGRRRKA